MTQPFADALTWVPKSRALGATLSQANDFARARSHGTVTLEHLLQALLEDGDAVQVLQTCNIDLDQLGRTIAAHLKDLPVSDEPIPGADPALLLIMQYAVDAAQQSRRREVTGAIILAAIVGEDKSPAAAMLLASGLTFQQTVRALQQGPPSPRPAAVGDVPPETAPPRTPAVEAAPSQAPSPGSTAPAPQPPPRPPKRNLSSAVSTIGDEDPVATARRRIEAARNGSRPHPLPRSPAVVATASVEAGPRPSSPEDEPAAAPHDPDMTPSPAFDHAYAVSTASGWTPPPPAPPATGSIAPAHRAPPMMPPIGPPMTSRRAPVAYEAEVRPAPASGGRWDGYSPDPYADPPPGRQYGAPWEAARSDVPVEHTETGVIGHLPTVQSAQPLSNETGFDRQHLSGAIPRRFKAGRSANIEIRLPRAALPSLASIRDSQMAPPGGSRVVAMAVSIRLKSLTRGVHVEAFGAETQWLDNRHDPMQDDEARWRWIVTPLRRGSAKIQLSTSFHNVASDQAWGEQAWSEPAWSETVPPDEIIAVAISPNYAQVGRRWLGWLATLLVGGAIGVLSNAQLLQDAQSLLARINAQ